MQNLYINTCFLNGFNALVLSKGGDLSALCESVDLDKEIFIKDSRLIPGDKFIYLLEAAAEQLNFPDIAMQLARQQDMMILAPLSPMLSRCSNVFEAFNVMIKYLKILVSGYHVDLSIKEDHVVVTFNLELPHIQELVQYQDYAMASAVNILYGLMGKSHPIKGCFFLRSEENKNRIADYSRYYGCPVAFNCNSLSLTISDTILHQSIGSLVEQINKRIKNAQLLKNDDIVTQVSNVIRFSLANGVCNIEDIAASMHYSQRTLQRKLSENNTSFSALLDSIRFNLANQYLKNTLYLQTDIAALLGYSNLSSFSRSYHRWSGVYPADVRKQMKNTR
jgi:AraC-like DNA-binding protein